MSFLEKNTNDLSSNEELLLKYLLDKLKPNTWPIRITDLPYGTALVGGSIRDGLLDRLPEKPDLDFVVKEEAIKLVKNLVKVGTIKEDKLHWFQ